MEVCKDVILLIVYTITQYERLLAWYCRLSVCISVYRYLCDAARCG